MRFESNQNKDEGRLILDGEVTLLQAEELLELLKQAFDTVQRVVIDVNETKDIDAACLQLLCAAHRTADKRGKELRLTSNRSDDFAARVSQTGLQHWPGCRFAQSSACLWIGGEQENVQSDSNS